MGENYEIIDNVEDVVKYIKDILGAHSRNIDELIDVINRYIDKLGKKAKLKFFKLLEKLSQDPVKLKALDIFEIYIKGIKRRMG